MAKPTALVVGASRGIGQGLLAKLSQAGYDVHGTTRQGHTAATSAADEASSTPFFAADLRNAESLHAAAKAYTDATAGRGLDVLVVCGATAGDEPLLDIDPVRMLDFYNTNVVGPLRAVQAFLPALRAGNTAAGGEGQRVIVLISSLASNAAMRAKNALAPPEQRLPISLGPYGGTKAGLNMLGIGLYSELEQERFKVVLVHPGLVNTDMAQAMIARVRARPEGEVPWTVIEVDESTTGIANLVRDATASKGPLLWYRDWRGNDLPW